MDPSRSLCAHLGSAPLERLAVPAECIVEPFDGAATACVTCPVCGAAAFLELIAWRPTDRVRIYALAGIDAADVALFRRNRDRGSCDLARLEQEAAALQAAAGPVERLIAIDLQDHRVVATCPRPPDWRPPRAGFAERGGAVDPGGWFGRLGIA